MSRPPGSGQRGDPVTFRPTKTNEPALREKAARKGMSVPRYAASIIDSFLEGRWQLTDSVYKNPPPEHSVHKQEALEAEPNDSVHENQVCRHPNHTIIGGGLHRCQHCGQTRSLTGTWS